MAKPWMQSLLVLFKMFAQFDLLQMENPSRRVFYTKYFFYKNEDDSNSILVSGDGDYKMLVDFLIQKNKFTKILFPNKKFASSLYKGLESKHFDYLSKAEIKEKIGKKKRDP